MIPEFCEWNKDMGSHCEHRPSRFFRDSLVMQGYPYGETYAFCHAHAESWWDSGTQADPDFSEITPEDYIIFSVHST